MSQSDESSGATPPRLLLRIYRVAPPMQFEKKKNKLRGAAFLLRPNEAALSVYDAKVIQPRQLLERFLRDTQKLMDTGSEETRLKMQRRLDANGRMPKEMYQKGWRVGVLDADTFQELGFLLEGPDDEAGHYSVFGTLEEFETVADVLAKAAQVLDEEQTLAS